VSHPFADAKTVALGLIRPIVEGRTVILTGSAARSALMASFIAEAGALPTRVDLRVSLPEARSRFAAYDRLIEHPTQEIRQLVDSLDPAGTALVYAGSFTSARQFCGRQIIGNRSIKSMEAERNDVQRELLALPGAIVSLVDGLGLHCGAPTVVQGVPDRGVAMATSHTYLIPDSASRGAIDELVTKLSQDCSRVVVSPFNAGLPCTFYGIVTETTVIDFGPVEALVSWDPQDWRIHAPGILRPAMLDRSMAESARYVVHNVVRLLRDRVGYVGAFGVDGTVTLAGYIIHEVNPRVCAGFALLDQLCPAIAPFAAFDLVLREVPDASGPLKDSLERAAAMIASNTAFLCRLWENPAYPPPTIGSDVDTWMRQVRAAAAGNHVPLTELKEA